MPDPSPFLTLSRHEPPRVSPKHALVSLSRSIEARARSAGPSARLWVCLQHVRFHTGRTRLLHRHLADSGVAVHVYGVGVRDGVPGPGLLRAHDVSEFGLLAAEWNVLLLTPNRGLGLSARELPETRDLPDARRRFEWVVSEDADDVRYAVASLPDDPFVVGHDFGRPRGADQPRSETGVPAYASSAAVTSSVIGHDV